MRTPIRWRLTFWYAALLAAILSLFGIVLYQALHRSLMSEAVTSIKGRASELLASINIASVEPTDDGEAEGAYGVLRSAIDDPELVLANESEGIYIEIADAAGTIVSRSASLRNMHLNDGTLLSRPVATASGTLEERRVPGIGRMAIYTVPILTFGVLRESARVGRSLQFIDNALERLRLILVAASAAGLLLAVAVGAALAKVAISPIERITKAARKINVHDLHTRLAFKGPDDEVTRLAAAFDAMLDRVEQGFLREQRFTGDVSHELRTPLTILKGTADVALRTGGDNVPEYRAALETVNRESDRMIRMVESLLLLVRVDAGKQVLRLSTVELASLVRETAETFSGRAQSLRVSLLLGQLACLRISADADRLRQLLSNLLANALEHTPRGGEVRISESQEGEWAVLTVSDTGVGIPSEHLPHIFERFYRVNPARSRENGGAGLGLSIVKWIAEAHRGTINVTSRVGEGTTCVVRLPLMED